MQKIAIVGAGFCGLALAFNLSSHLEVTLIDSLPIGGGTSGMAAGLLHPFAGAHSKLNWRGFEGYQATCELLDIASHSLTRSVIGQKGILRLALNADQQLDYSRCADAYPSEVKWLQSEQVQELYCHLVAAPGLWIEKGLIVHSSLYLEGLWKACAGRVRFVQSKVHSLAELDEYDQVVLAAGGTVNQFSELASCCLTALKGQVLTLRWPEGISPLTLAVNSYVYALMSESKQTCLVGGTFERNYHCLEPDIEYAKKELLPKLEAMLPVLTGAKVVECRAGVRSVTPTHLPLVQQFGPQQWVIAGMGSKGLLYHALMAKELANLILGFFKNHH